MRVKYLKYWKKMQTDTYKKLSTTTIILHWSVAILIMGLLASGLYMTQFKSYSVYPWHKSFGVVVVVFVLFRVLWRLKNGWPIPVGNYSSVEHFLAKIVHYILIFSTIAMPVSGMLMSVMSGRGLYAFGFEVFAPNLDALTQERVAIDSVLAGRASIAHQYIAYLMCAVLALHILGAFKHHIIDKDATLKRMLGKSVE